MLPDPLPLLSQLSHLKSSRLIDPSESEAVPWKVQLRSRLSADHGVEVRDLVLDLTDGALATAVGRETEHLEIGLLVCNAAFSVIGPFLEQPLEKHLTELELNCRATLVLAEVMPFIAHRTREIAGPALGACFPIGFMFLATSTPSMITSSSLIALRVGASGTAYILPMAVRRGLNLILLDSL